MNRLLETSLIAVLSLPVVACTYGGERHDSGQCPAGEVCSDLTPGGLHFIGNSIVNDVFQSGPRATAIGGTQIVSLEYDDQYGFDVPLDLVYTADDDGGIGVRVEGTSGALVTVRGAGSRENYLRILDSDGLLMDRKMLAGAALDRMELVASSFYESVPNDLLLAFAPGEREIGVALYGDVQQGSTPVSERIVDTSMELTLAGAQRIAWDRLSINATVGTHSLAVTAGDKPTNTLDVVVVDGADAMEVHDNTSGTIAPNQSRSICFSALNAGRYIVGLTWTFDVDGETKIQGEGSISRNCVSVSTTKTSGIVAVSASAGGQSAQISLSVATARTVGPSPSIKQLPTNVTIEGDRRSM